MKFFVYATVLFSIFTAPAFATVSVQSPANGATVGVAATFVATATTATCSRGVASMGVYVDNSLQYVRAGNSLNTIVSLSPGSHNTVVEEWDNCGGATYTPIAVTADVNANANVNQAGVLVSSPVNNSTVSSQVNFTATATTNCQRGVASMGVYVDNQLIYTSNGSSLNTQLTLGSGRHNTVVEEWDYCGGATYTPVAITTANQAGVSIASPVNNSTVSPRVNYTATATTTCPQGVASMGVYVNNQLIYTSNGSSLNTQLTLGSGAQHTVVQEWDYCGGSTYTPVDVNVASSGKVIANIQASGGWKAYGQFAPDYSDCVSNCSGVNWSMSQHVASPSLTGNATRYDIGGSTPYADVLWTNPLIGQFSTQNLPDSDHKLVPTVHNFTYDANVYVTNVAVTQVLEFDINMYMNGVGMLWGTQCNHLGGGVWDIWDNGSSKWVTANIPCNLVNGWNHVTIQAQRQPNNDVLYQSITLNGQTFNINRTSAPFSVSSSWWGITVNYQMDGDHKQSPNTTYVDNFSLTYW